MVHRKLRWRICTIFWIFIEIFNLLPIAYVKTFLMVITSHHLWVCSRKRDGIPTTCNTRNRCLALQCIVEVLESELKKAQPSQKAYYSRTHTPEMEHVDGTFAYPWWILWQFKRIWKFTNLYKYVVVWHHKLFWLYSTIIAPQHFGILWKV